MDHSSTLVTPLGFGNVRKTPDLITAKLPALHFRSHITKTLLPLVERPAHLGVVTSYWP
jgi:hypothetical protein